MERHAKALGIKYIIISIVTFSLFGVFINTTLAELFFMSVLLTLFAYFIGDVFIYPRLGNIIATFTDFAFYFILTWLWSYGFVGMSLSHTIASLAAAYLLTMTEPLFHTYMKEKILVDAEEDMLFEQGALQTEIAEEMPTKSAQKEEDKK